SSEAPLISARKRVTSRSIRPSAHRHRAGEVDPTSFQPPAECPLKLDLLLSAKMLFPSARPPIAEMRIRPRPALPHHPEQSIKLALVRLHEREATAIQDEVEPFWGDIQFTEPGDPTQAGGQVVHQILIVKEQHVGIIAVGPPAFDVSQPGAV